VSDKAAAAAPTGTIHDQGYQRYEGTRTPQARRFLVIARNVVAVAWKSRWGVKLPVLLTAFALVITAGVLVLMTKVQALMHGPVPDMLRVDRVLAISCSFFTLFGVVLTITVAMGAIADDLRSGAFQFYFSRPLRPADYVRGKLLGLFVVVGSASFAGPVVLAIVRVALVENLAQARAALHILPACIVIGVLGTLALVLPAVGLASLLRQRVAAQAAFIVYWVVLANAAVGLSYNLRLPALGLLSLSNDLQTVTRALLGVRQELRSPEPWQAALVIVGVAVVGYVALARRIRSASTAGIGGV
jgi:ABC-2 type transport system permease protein